MLVEGDPYLASKLQEVIEEGMVDHCLALAVKTEIIGPEHCLNDLQSRLSAL